jgi:L-asparaginase II
VPTTGNTRRTGIVGRDEREAIGMLDVEDDGAVEGIDTDREIALAVADHEGNLSTVTVENIVIERQPLFRRTMIAFGQYYCTFL